MAERDYIISEERHRPRRHCRRCGEDVYDGTSFYSDGYQTIHMDCYFKERTESANGGNDDE